MYSGLNSTLISDYFIRFGDVRQIIIDDVLTMITQAVSTMYIQKKRSTVTGDLASTSHW